VIVDFGLWGIGPAVALALAAGPLEVPAEAQEVPSDPLAVQCQNPREGLCVNREAGTVSFQATVQAEAFSQSLPPDHQYHAVVNREGSAAGKALFVTDADDGELARTLREMGARDGGGVPMAAWDLRWVPLVSAPASRVAGTRVEVRVTWEGAQGSYELHELLEDSGGEGIEMRFGGNEEHDHHWNSGCILCLFSCPGGVISNAAYTIRDHQRSRTLFEAGHRLPQDGTQVTITLELAPD